MGSLLSHPSKTIFIETGHGRGYRYATAEMQGWRDHMEDAHISTVSIRSAIAKQMAILHTNYIKPYESKLEEFLNSNEFEDIAIFGIFDGHCGKEVANFVKLFFLLELSCMESFRTMHYHTALKKTFHRMDELLESDIHDELLQILKCIPNPSDAQHTKSPRESFLVQHQPIYTVEPKSYPMKIIPTFSLVQVAPLPVPQFEPKPHYDENISYSQHIQHQMTEHNHHLHGHGHTNCHPQSQHQKSQAGCTALVALFHNETLYVANAGDSRGILGHKNGDVKALSCDHKPTVPLEKRRIENAGGFVNHVGRINGNLDVSRTLGDLRFKQNTYLDRAHQIVSPDPDIVTVLLTPEDRFVFLACDGVWNCLSNQDACKFISDSLNSGKVAQDIVRDICQKCLAEEANKKSGIGTDNVSCVLILLSHGSKYDGTVVSEYCVI